MKKLNKKKVVASLLLCGILILSSCGASFNTVGIKMGNLINDAQWTSQTDSDFHIEEDGIYRNNKKILDGDYSNINAVGEKIYFYDKSIRTICKASFDGFKVQRIGEIYTDTFVVHKDNIIVSILVGSGSEDLEAPSNYNIVKMKITDRKLTSQSPKVIYEGGKFIGSDLNRVYFIREDKKQGYVLASIDLDGENFKDIGQVSKDAQIIVSGEDIFLLESNEKEYGIFSMNFNGKKKLIKKVGKNPDGTNAFNLDGDKIYYENYDYDEEEEIETSSIERFSLKDKKSKEMLSRDKRTDFAISVGKDGIFVKERAHEDIDSHKKWEKLK